MGYPSGIAEIRSQLEELFTYAEWDLFERLLPADKKKKLHEYIVSGEQTKMGCYYATLLETSALINMLQALYNNDNKISDESSNGFMIVACWVYTFITARQIFRIGMLNAIKMPTSLDVVKFEEIGSPISRQHSVLLIFLGFVNEASQKFIEGQCIYALTAAMSPRKIGKIFGKMHNICSSALAQTCSLMQKCRRSRFVGRVVLLTQTVLPQDVKTVLSFRSRFG